MTERLTVTGIGHYGDGIAQTPDGEVYIPFAVPGDIVEVEPEPGHPDRRHLLRVEVPSAERITPICPHFGACGGCAVQQWSEPSYRAWKRGLLVDIMARAGIEAPVDDLIDAHGAGRRRAVLHARRATHDVLAVGFAAPRAHRIVPIDRCPIFAPNMDGAIEAAWAIAEALDPTGKPLDIHVTATNEGLDIDVRGSGPLAPERTAALARFAAAHRLARITRHGEIVAQRIVPTVTLGRASVPLPPGAFLQPTAAGEAVLAALVTDAVGDAHSVADLFCGIGPFALRLAERIRVTAADSDEAAIAALKRGAANAGGLKPIKTAVRDLYRWPYGVAELSGFDAIVFDPPRQGALAQARALATSKVPVLVAVSCNPSTFVRDVKVLLDSGYRLTRVTPVDQFRYAPHLEIVARLAQ